MVATAGKPHLKQRAHLFQADYLPGDIVSKRATFVVTNGGSPATYQALSNGCPVLGVAHNMDQLMCMSFVESAGAGILLRADQLSKNRIRSCIKELMQRKSFMVRSEELNRELQQFDFSSEFLSCLRDFLEFIIGNQKMEECTTCNVCDEPETLNASTEQAQVPCHVHCFRDESFTVWRCKNCGSLHSKEVVDLERFYASYPFKDHKLDFHTRIGYRNRLNLLKRQGAKPNHLILDYGCGAGLYVKFLREQGFQNVHGYDPFIPHFADDQILEKKFDIVVSHDVIEHVEEPIHFLENMVRLLKPNGLLVLGTPNASEISLRSEDVLAVELSQPYHRHILSEKALSHLAERFALEPVHTYRRFYFDSFIPSVNTKFMWKYVELNGGFIDVCVKPPK